MNGLTFDYFRAANLARCLKWHPQGIESWSASDWLTALMGELGELASLIKMRNRERDGLPGNKFSPTDKMIADEMADVFTYLDLAAAAAGVDLGEAVVAKFNAISERVGFPDRIAITPPPIEFLFRDDRLPAPDENGMFCHPDLDIFCGDGKGRIKRPEDEAIIDKDLMASAGWEMSAEIMDNDNPAHAEYFFHSRLAHWEPEPPNATWKLVGKFDGEDGAQAIFVRRIGTPDPVEPTQAAMPL